MALDKAKQEQFKTMLKEEAERVEDRKNRTHNGVKEATSCLRRTSDDGEKAESSHRLEVDLDLCQSSAQDLKKIRLALARIEEGIFGQCTNFACDNEIPLARLQAVPWADKCLKCQKAEEKKSAASKPVYQARVADMEEEEV